MRKVNSYLSLGENDKLPESSLITNVTFNELVQLKTDGKLSAKTYYTITDFNTTELAHGSNDVIINGVNEPLTLLAITPTSFLDRAFSSLHPTDVIIYDVDYVLCEDAITPCKGRIIRRTDKFGNSTPWDFRNVKHKMITIGVDNYSDLLAYNNGTLVKKNGWIYKAAGKAATITPPGNDPETPNSPYWIKFLPVGSNLIPIEPISGANTDNLGTCSDENVVIENIEYWPTFTNSAGEQISDMFQNVVIEDNCNNIVCIKKEFDFFNLTIGKNTTNLRITGEVRDSIIKGDGDNNIIDGEFIGVTSNGYPFNNNILGNFRSVVINGIFGGNIIRSAVNGCVFNSETVYNSIDSLTNGTTGSDLWACRICILSYYELAYRFTDCFLEIGNQFTTKSSCLNSDFPGENIGVTILMPISDTIFPSNMKRIIVELTSEYGIDFSSISPTIIADLSDSSLLKKIVGDDNVSFSIMKYNSSGALIKIT